MQTVKYGPYSPSRLDTAACPLRFKRQYIDKDLGDTSSDASRRGNVVHETNEFITKGWLEKKPVSWSEVEAMLASKLTQYKITNGDDVKLCVGAARCYMENPPEGLDEILGTEEHLALKITPDGKFVECDWDDPTCFVRCKIDILRIKGNKATIIDHKTQMHIEDADTFQMSFYAWMVKQFYPYITEIDTILHFAHPSLNFYSRPVTWTMEDVKMIETEIKVRIAAIEGIEEYHATPSAHCNYCPMVLECPKIAELNKRRTQYGNVKAGPVVGAQEAKEIAEVLTVIDLGYDVLNSRLQKFVKEIGPVDILGKRYENKISEKYELPDENKKAMWDFLEKSGHDPMNFVDFDIKKIQNLWKAGAKGSFFEEVKKFLRVTKSSRFGGRKL